MHGVEQMVEFRLDLRGQCFAEWVRNGGYHGPPDFIDLVSRRPEPLLPQADLTCLIEFLESAPQATERWSVAQRHQAKRLLALVEASPADVLVPEAKELLCKLLAGKSLLPPGRPRRMVKRSGGLDDRLACHVHEIVARQLAAPDAVSEPFAWGAVPVYEQFKSLPPAERALRTTYEWMRERGLAVPSFPRFRNRISAYRQEQKRARQLLSGGPAR